MTRAFVVLIAILGVLPSTSAQTVRARQGSGAPSPEITFVTTYCVTCHNAQRKTANLMLDRISPDQPGADAEVWEKVVRKLRAGGHPPIGPTRPDKTAETAFVAALEAGLDRAAPSYWTSALSAPLDDVALANRLAAFLWRDKPDAELQKLAGQRKLTNPAVLEQQARRMLKAPRAQAFIDNFFGEWLYLKNVPALKPSREVFPDFDTSLLGDFQRETKMFLDYQLREDRGVMELLSANYTFLNERLAKHYGMAGVKGSQFRRVPLADDARGGLLGQASILGITSYATRTSPVLRGKWVLETFLGAPVPPPPANVPALKENASSGETMRDRLAAHTKNPVCASCHVGVDAIGFGLENFDAVGRWRNTDQGKAIDASGAFADGTAFNGPGDLRRALVNERAEAIVGRIAERLLAQALGRRIGYFDLPAARSVVRDAASQGYRWSALIAGIVRSTPFQTRRIERQATTVASQDFGRRSTR